MGKVLALAAGVLMFAVGLLWTLQGLDYVGGSSMSGQDQWAVIGPAVATCSWAWAEPMPSAATATAAASSFSERTM